MAALTSLHHKGFSHRVASPEQTSLMEEDELDLETRPRWRLWAGIAVALIAVAVLLFFVRHRAPEAPAYQTVQVDRGAIVARITATGTLSALVTVQVGSQVSGRLAEINVDFNSPVKKGEVIAKIDPSLYEAALEQARANTMAAQANVAKAKAQSEQSQADYERSQGLRDKGLISAAELQTARSTNEVNKAQLRAAQAALAQSNASLHQAQVNLSYTQITSPINGVVISRSVDVGQTVAASLQAPTLFTIAEDMRRMQVDTSVAEADVGRLKAGMKAYFTVDAFPSERFEGTIRQIRNAPTTVQNVVTYDAVIDVANDKLELKPGMTANVTVVYAENQDALRVPNAALRFRPPNAAAASGAGRAGAAGGASVARTHAGGSRGTGRGGSGGHAVTGGHAGAGGHGAGQVATPNQKTVYVLRNGEAEPVKVQVGITDGTSTEIEGGDLHEGDTLITGMAQGGAAPGGTGQRKRPLRF